MQEWKISFCFQKANHEKHKEPDAKALQYKMVIDIEKRENALQASIDRFEAELKTAKQPGRAVIQSLLAESY